MVRHSRNVLSQWSHIQDAEIRALQSLWEPHSNNLKTAHWPHLLNTLGLHLFISATKSLYSNFQKDAYPNYSLNLLNSQPSLYIPKTSSRMMLRTPASSHNCGSAPRIQSHSHASNWVSSTMTCQVMARNSLAIHPHETVLILIYSQSHSGDHITKCAQRNKLGVKQQAPPLKSCSKQRQLKSPLFFLGYWSASQLPTASTVFSSWFYHAQSSIIHLPQSPLAECHKRDFLSAVCPSSTSDVPQSYFSHYRLRPS